MSVKVRTAVHEDRERILAISSQIWAGEDYVPLVLDAWLAEGGLLVAEIHGQVVGFAKNTDLGEGEIWLEGLRVDPAHEGKGLAKTLAQRQLATALAGAPRSIRLATVETNYASLHIAQTLGFREIARFSYLEADVKKPQKAPAVARPDPKEAWQFLQKSAAFRAGRGLIPLGWRFKTATEHFLHELWERGAIFSVGAPPKGLLILAPDPYTPKDIAVLAFLDGEEEALLALANFAHFWAAQNGQRTVAAMVADPFLFTFLGRLGFQGVPELGAVVVLEHDGLRGDPGRS